MCIALGIPQCSYYQWSKQETARAERKVREERLVQKVRDTFEENHRVYGCPKMQAALNDKGIEVKEWKLRTCCGPPNDHFSVKTSIMQPKNSFGRDIRNRESLLAMTKCADWHNPLSQNSAFLCSYFSFHLLYLKGKVFYD